MNYSDKKTIIKINVDENGNGKFTVISEKIAKKVCLEISARFCNKKYSFDFTGENPGLSDCFVLEGAAAWSVATPNL